MNILVTGGSGMIGTKFLEFFKKKNFSFTFNKNSTSIPNGYQLDITDKEKTISLITKLQPDIVIHTAALANVDLCETDKEIGN